MSFPMAIQFTWCEKDDRLQRLGMHREVTTTTHLSVTSGPERRFFVECYRLIPEICQTSTEIYQERFASMAALRHECKNYFFACV